jgi:hypothetical protein
VVDGARAVPPSLADLTRLQEGGTLGCGSCVFCVGALAFQQGHLSGRATGGRLCRVQAGEPGTPDDRSDRECDQPNVFGHRPVVQDDRQGGDQGERDDRAPPVGGVPGA